MRLRARFAGARSAAAVRLAESGQAVKPEVLAYLNRLSDLIWLFGRLIELNAGIDARLRDGTKAGPKWSRAVVVEVGAQNKAFFPGRVPHFRLTKRTNLSGRQ